MVITFDAAKRERTLASRGVDFLDAAEVFAGVTVTRPDQRRDYGEERWITAGMLRDRFVVIAWTQRGVSRRVISMRYGHGHEEDDWFRNVDRS
jgi:uncharacterized DUF497 family protein